MADIVRPARRGLMLILSSPSGAGKSTLTRNLSQNENNLDLSVSVTTRPRRPSELPDVHYRFIDRPAFDEMRRRDDLLEFAEVHGNGYGTPRKEVEASLASGRDVLFDIDWQGTQQIVKKARADVVTIFILPPSMAELRSRLVRRAEDAPDVIAKLRPEATRPGEIVDLEGRRLGQHEGIIHYTVGQRRGLKLSVGEPLYVVRLEPETARVVVGPRAALATRRIRLTDLNWLGEGAPEAIGDRPVAVRVRSTREPRPARLSWNAAEACAEIELVAPEDGVSPGQACVIYADEDSRARRLRAAPASS